MSSSRGVPDEYLTLKAAADQLDSAERGSQAVGLLEIWKQEATLRAKFGVAHNHWIAQLFPSGAYAKDFAPAELRLVPICVTTQHAVGHGGFHSGVLGLGVPELRWIYDCGSWRKVGKRVLQEAIRHYAEAISLEGPRARRPVDLLFLSHFDADHVSGLKTLLQLVKIDTVVVPYLDELARAVVLTEAVASGQSTTDLRSLLFDPAGWFGRRGVRRLVEVRPGPPGPDTFVGGRPEDGDHGSGGFDPVLLDPFKQPIDSQAERAPRCAIQSIVPAGSSFAVHGPRHWSDFVLLPYAFSATEPARRRAKEAIEAFLGVPITSHDFRDRLLDQLRTRKGRKSIAALYLEAGLGDANAISLSLYSGSVRSDSARYRLAHGPYWPPGRAGWMLTGDAKLRSPIRRKEWLRYFEPLKSNIGFLMLPHHGSAANFDREILESVPEEAALYVTANASDHGLRPHEDLLAQLGERHLHVVTEQPESELREISGPSLLTGNGGAIRRFCANWY